MATAFVEDRVLSLVEQRLKDAQAPVKVKLVERPGGGPAAAVARHGDRALAAGAHDTSPTPAWASSRRATSRARSTLEGNFRDVLRAGRVAGGQRPQRLPAGADTLEVVAPQRAARTAATSSITTTFATISTACGWIATGSTPAPTSSNPDDSLDLAQEAEARPHLPQARRSSPTSAFSTSAAAGAG